MDIKAKEHINHTLTDSHSSSKTELGNSYPQRQSKGYIMAAKSDPHVDQNTVENLMHILHGKIKKETDQLIHELELHQIELEMQNEQLQRTQIGLEDAKKWYFDLYELAPVGYCTLDEYGVIVQTNLTIAQMLGHNKSTLLQHQFSNFVINED